MTTLEKLNNHPAVHSVEIEYEYGVKTYWVELKDGFSTYGGLVCGREYSLADVKKFLKEVEAHHNL